ncbi:hypothetical protein PG988_005977 [Apiospora saccharicola]
MAQAQAPGVLARLPLEIRFDIYDLTFKQRTHKFVCFHPDLIFIRTMDLSVPNIASAMAPPGNVRQLVYQSKYDNVDVDDLKTNAIETRFPAWFSTSYDTIDIQSGNDTYGANPLGWLFIGEYFLPPSTIDHPETEFHRLLKMKRDVTIQTGQPPTHSLIILARSENTVFQWRRPY